MDFLRAFSEPPGQHDTVIGRNDAKGRVIGKVGGLALLHLADQGPDTVGNRPNLQPLGLRGKRQERKQQGRLHNRAPISSAVSTLPVETTFSSTTRPGVDITP